MTFLLQSLKDFANNHFSLLRVGATLGAGALLALGYCYCRKKREMSSFPNLTNNPTIAGKLLTPDMFSILKDKRTSKGYDIDNLIESSQHNLSANFTAIPNSAGLLAGDEECYDLFGELIDPVIREVYQIDDMKSLRSEVNFNWRQIKGGKIYGANVLSCRLSTSRNIQGYRLIPGCPSEELLDIAHLIMKTLKSIEGAFEESYLSLPWQHKKLALLDYGLNPNSFPPQLSRDWPKGRFIWVTADRQCRIFVNFIDHMKLVITQPGGDIQKAFRQYSKLLSAIEGCLTRKGNKFMWSSKYGFLTSSPHDIGTGLEVQVKARLPKLTKDPRYERIIDVLLIKVELSGMVCVNSLSHDEEHMDLPKSFLTLEVMGNGEINTKQLKGALKEKFPSLKLKIFDFAGDREYYSFHHMFLKSCALFVIVFNIAKLAEDNFQNVNTDIERLQFWLESVCSHVPPKTPIFLVGTHRGDLDKICMKILNSHLKKKLWKPYCDELVVNDVDELIFFPVENSNGGNDVGVQSLRIKVMSVAEKIETASECDIPLSWITIQDAIISLREKKKAKFCVTLEEFPTAFDRFICSNWSEETLKYFHEKGLVIYFDKDQDLSNWVLLKPEILVDIIIQLVTPPPQMIQERGFRRDWELLHDKGSLTKSLLTRIISTVQENEAAMTAFLEEYDLICPLSNNKVKMRSLYDGEHKPTHFVPSLLPMSADGCIPAWHDDTTDKKFYVFFKRFLPEPLFHRLLSRAHKNSMVEFPNGPAIMFKDVGKFWMRPCQPYRLKLMKEEAIIEVTFSSSNMQGMKPADVLCQVFSIVDGICKRNFSFVKFHCGPACPSHDCPGYQDNYIVHTTSTHQTSCI